MNIFDGLEGKAIAERLYSVLGEKYGQGWLRGFDTKNHMSIAKDIEKKFGAQQALNYLEEQGFLEPGFSH